MGVPGLHQATCALGRRVMVEVGWDDAGNLMRLDRTEPTAAIIDGSALVYHLLRGNDHESSTAWQCGGDAPGFARRLRVHLRVLRVVFPRALAIVMDGGRPEAKLATAVRRANDSLRRVRACMHSLARNGDGPHAKRRVKHSAASGLVLPPHFIQLAVDVIVSAMDDDKHTAVDLFHLSADNADRDIACLARHDPRFARGDGETLILSNDSDFHVYAVGCGYAPLDEFLVPSLLLLEENAERRETAGAYAAATVIATVYRSQDVARHFGLTPELLPLLASLCGNDYVDSSCLSLARVAKDMKEAMRGRKAMHGRKRRMDESVQDADDISAWMLGRMQQVHHGLDVATIRRSMEEYDTSMTLDLTPQRLQNDCAMPLPFHQHRFVDVVERRRFWCTPVLCDLDHPVSPWMLLRPLRALCYRVLCIEHVEEYVPVGGCMSRQEVNVGKVLEECASLEGEAWLTMVDDDTCALEPRYQLIVCALRYVVEHCGALEIQSNHIRALLLCVVTTSKGDALLTELNSRPTSINTIHTLAMFTLAIEHLLTLVQLRSECSHLARVRFTDILVDGTRFHAIVARLEQGVPWTADVITLDDCGDATIETIQSMFESIYVGNIVAR